VNTRFQNLARRFGDARPGQQLVAVEEAAIPITTLRVDVLAQERQPLPITEEFLLRFVHRGTSDRNEIARYLGLDAPPVVDAVAAQIQAGNLRQTLNGELRLTALGEVEARELATVQPVDRSLPIAFDRLTWRIAAYDDSDLLEKRDAQEAGLRLLPADRKARIGLADVPAPELNRLIASDTLQVLRVRKTNIKKHRYLPVQLLVYADLVTRELDLAVCIDDELANDHGVALARADAVTKLGLKYEGAEERPILDDDLEEHRADAVFAEPSTGEGDALGALEPSTMSSLVRGVSVFEHPDLLAEALDTASSRLLIVSPWVRRAVITTDFLARLERRLRAGVTVTIAHGYGDDDRGSDEDALRKLANLAKRFEKFTFARVSNTHAKILIFDGTWISTSFNWLSFRGDQDRTYRMEEGTLVTIPNRVDAEYERYVALIAERRIDGL
jgi:hypothetical protein